MSILTTKPVKVAPSAAAGVVPTLSGAWTASPAWSEILASAPADLAIAGVVLEGGTSASQELEIEVGVGGSGSEAAVGTIRLVYASGATAPLAYVLPAPFSGVSAGNRVAIRARSQSGLASMPGVWLLYYESFDSDLLLTAPACVPAAADGVAITPSGTAWANSAWVQLTAGLASEISIFGVAYGAQNANVDLEFDLGTGASGAESVIATLRNTSNTADAGGLTFCHLPAVHPVAASTRVAARVRKSGTGTTDYNVTLLYYGSSLLAAPGGGSLKLRKTLSRAGTRTGSRQVHW